MVNGNGNIYIMTNVDVIACGRQDSVSGMVNKEAKPHCIVNCVSGMVNIDANASDMVDVVGSAFTTSNFDANTC